MHNFHRVPPGIGISEFLDVHCRNRKEFDQFSGEVRKNLTNHYPGIQQNLLMFVLLGEHSQTESSLDSVIKVMGLSWIFFPWGPPWPLLL